MGGLVKPDDPDAKVKFLAAEALRGVGGLVFDANGKRFANELGRRDYVTGEMWKNKPPFRLCLNKAAGEEIIWHCKHYTGRGVMKYYENGADLAKDMGVSLQTLVDEHQQHYEASQKAAKDPEGGSWPAYPSGKSWDAASGPTGSGKKFYHNIIPGSAVATEPFYVAIITPVIHYCMGGLEVTKMRKYLAKMVKFPVSMQLVKLLVASMGTTGLEGTPCLIVLSMVVWLAGLHASTHSVMTTSSERAHHPQSSRH